MSGLTRAEITNMKNTNSTCHMGAIKKPISPCLRVFCVTQARAYAENLDTVFTTHHISGQKEARCFRMIARFPGGAALGFGH